MSYLRLLTVPKHLYTTCTSFLDTLLSIHNHYYSIFEHNILQNEESTRFRIKKSILLYHSYLSIIFCLVIPFFNPQASLFKSAVHILLAVGLMFILRGKNYHLIGSYVYVQATISVLLHYFTEKEPLTLLGHVLANQHMFFLFPEAEVLRKLYIPLVIFLIQHMLRKLTVGMGTWNYDQVETSIRSLDHAWVIIFLFHHYGARNLTTSYRLALINNMEIQTKLKETLSLLETTNTELTKALHARELFIASVSHELRNPLNCMIGNIELLRLDIKNEKWLRMLNICKICSEVLLGQINNVLDVAKINAEKLELHCVPGNFHRLVEKVWNISAIPIKQKRLKGEVRIASDFPKYIMMDSHRLTQILLNLIGNASKFAKEGFINISITWHHNEPIEELRKPNQEFMALVTRKRKPSSSTDGTRSLNLDDELDSGDQLLPSLEIGDHTEKSFAIEGVLHRDLNPKLISQVLTSRYIHSTTDDVAIENKVEPKSQHIAHEKGIIKIEVVDSGCGISPEALNKLFQPFTQADSSITRQYGGTGLGLYITKQIVQKMGGEIFAYSHEHIGSDFCVLIPAETVNKEDVKDEECCVPPSEHNLEKEEIRALVVDDLPGNQLVLTSYLQKLGVRSETANNGAEAVNMFKNKGPNYYTFVTMDLQMPKMDGLTATKLIRKYEESMGLEDTPIIVITGNCAETEKAKCVDPKGELRAYGFYRKPFTFDECRSMLQSITLEKKALQLSQQRHPKVLIVDDDAFNTTVTQEYLEKHGFRCTGSSNGKEATQVAAKEKFDFIMMDCEMPEMDGYTAASIIKKNNPDAIILGVTGHRREEILQKCTDSGMFDVETKPIDFRKVVSVISRMTSQSAI